MWISYVGIHQETAGREWRRISWNATGAVDVYEKKEVRTLLGIRALVNERTAKNEVDRGRGNIEPMWVYEGGEQSESARQTHEMYS